MPIKRHNRVSDEELLALLQLFESATNVDENKRIHFLRWESDEVERILPDAFDADRSFTPRQLRYLLRDALWECRRKGLLTNKVLVAEVQRLANIQLAEQNSSFSMFTKFRSHQMGGAPIIRIRWDDVTLQISNSLPLYMRQSEYIETGIGPINPYDPTGFGYLIARCKTRSAENAVAQMINASEVFMAVFNMYESWGRRTRGDVERWAQGKLWHGPYHIVFRNRKRAGQDGFWYEPNFSMDDWKTRPLKMCEILKEVPRVQNALIALSGHPMRDVLIRVLKLIQNAMSTRDQNYRILRYWSALEQLYGDPKSRQKNSKDIIERAIFTETDKLLARWKLQHISRMRNEYAHAGEIDDDLFVMSQYLRDLLSWHINYLLFHAPAVNSHEHWLEIVDLPDDKAELNRHKSTIDLRNGMMPE
jgi:hypothetical protein